MNVNMWRHPATQANVETLRKRGHRIVEPGEGYLACGMTGPGRLAEPETIASGAAAAAGPGRGDGPDHGGSDAGASGPGAVHFQSIEREDGIRAGRGGGVARGEGGPGVGAGATCASGRSRVGGVGTAREMRDAVMARLEASDIVIKSAAVADFHLAQGPEQKVKKTAARLSLELDPTPDILARGGRKKTHQLLVGFAAETQNVTQEARRKLEAKNCDMVVGNDVSGSETGFESDLNEVVLALRTGEIIQVGRSSKREIAERIFDEALKLRLALHAHGQ